MKMRDDKIKMMGEPQNYEQSKKIGNPTLNNLLCCPFCGNTNLNKDYEDHDAVITYWVECPTCEVVMEGSAKRDLYFKWNSRAK